MHPSDHNRLVLTSAYLLSVLLLLPTPYPTVHVSNLLEGTVILSMSDRPQSRRSSTVIFIYRMQLVSSVESEN